MTRPLGTTLRMARLLNPESGRGFGVAFDHGLHIGNCPGVENPGQTIADIAAAGADAVILAPGMAIQHGPTLAGRDRPALILRLDQTTMWRDGPLAFPDGRTRLIATVDDALAMGADAVITYLFVGHTDPALEDQSFENCVSVNTRARAVGMPHIIETMAARNARPPKIDDPDLVTAHTRIGAEMGADILKTDWPGSVEALKRITADLDIPVMLAGGPRAATDRDTLAFVAQVVEGGAAGILFGRSVLQAENRPALMRAARGIIHDGMGLDEAMAVHF